MAAYTHTTPENPNERYGVRACSAAGHQKHVDCDGQWTELLSVRAASLQPHVVICDAHLLELAKTRGFRTPKVTERKPPRVSRSRNAPEEVLSL